MFPLPKTWRHRAKQASPSVDLRRSKPFSDTDTFYFHHQKQSWTRRYLSGWRAGALLSCIAAFTVLSINLSTLLWMAHYYQLEHGVGTLFTGSCAKAKSINTWVGLGINALCSILLGASNYCMQCLTSPTRQEVNKAHKSKRLLQIGVPSVRNLKAMSLNRVLLWFGLGLSAFPLHFL